MKNITIGVFAVSVILAASCKEFPVASFEVSTLDAAAGDTIHFYSTCQNATSFEWDFKDGTVSTEENPSHSFSNTGNYEVELTAFNKDGSDMAVEMIHILAPLPLGWAKLPRLLTPRHAHVSVALDNVIYVAGGITTWYEFEAYDLSKGSWNAKVDIPTLGEYGSGCVLNGNIYFIGGWDDITLDIVALYDPTRNIWETKSPMLTTKGAHVAVPYKGKIYVIGGCTGWPITEFYNSVEIYDPEADSWTSQSMGGTGLTPRWGHGACLANDKLYVMGGTDAKYYSNLGDDVPALDIVEEYDLETNSWTQKTSMPTARWGLTLATINNKIYAIGGASRYDYNSELTPVVEEYDPVTDTWTSKAEMPQGLLLPRAVVVDDIIYITGGGGMEQTDAYDTFYSYDPALDTVGQ